jgi:anti-anti-sigma regulatory factor
VSAWMRIEAPEAVERELDLAQARCILAEGLDVAIDMFETKFISASGCRAVLDLHGHAVAMGRTVTIVGARGIVVEVMTLTGLTKVVAVIAVQPGRALESYDLRF